MPWNVTHRGARIGIVCVGYALALLASGLACAAYNAEMATKPYDTSGGMYAGGEMMTGIGVFLVVALAPTLLALWFMRNSPALWLTVAIGALAFAGAGLTGVLVPLVTREAPHDLGLMMLELLGIAQLLGVPFWTAAFVLFAVMAPTRPARRLLMATVCVELVIGVCAGIHWLAQRPF